MAPEDKVIVREQLDDAVELCQPVIFVGCAKGVDQIVRDYANEYGIELRKFVADWKGLGKSAGPKRNAQMVKAFFQFLTNNPEAEYRAFAFPGPHSIGTWNCLRKIVALGLEVRVRGLFT